MNPTIKYAGIFLIAVITLALLPKQRDYQLDVGKDNIRVYDGSRYVGTITLQDTSNITELDNLILLDNQ
jgi:hypothetical protein